MAISVVCWAAMVHTTEGFVPAPIVPTGFAMGSPTKHMSLVQGAHESGGRFQTWLELQKGWFVPDNGNDGDRSDETQERYVTREMLHRDLLADPQVKRKNKKKAGYIPLDNRDHLPYVVKQITPDPYTKYDVKKSKQVLSKPNNKQSDLDLIGSRLSVRALNKNDPSTILGEFQLDKSTTSGDIICISDRTYKVETARCQYKYAGGQRFLMVRKILEVKEITRAIQEAQLQKQLSLSVGTQESKFDDSDKIDNL